MTECDAQITPSMLLARGWEYDPLGDSPHAIALGVHTGSDCYLMAHFRRGPQGAELDCVNLETQREAVFVSKEFRTYGDLLDLLKAMKLEPKI